MKHPSIVSKRHMPAAKSTGSDKIAQNGNPPATAFPANTSRATSVAVSNPSPKRTPTGYIFHGLSIRSA